MEFVAIPLVLLAISLVVKLVMWLVKRRPSRPPVRTGASPALPTFRVVALGGTGAGKTVSLSSLFHTLSYRTPGRSYHLSTDAAQRVALGSLYRAVSDT